jgi:hypothetical protein
MPPSPDYTELPIPEILIPTPDMPSIRSCGGVIRSRSAYDRTTGIHLHPLRRIEAQRRRLSWYDLRKHPKLDGNIPLENGRCSRLSIYLRKRDGSLWTVKFNGEAYSQVRDSKQAVPRDVYVCLCCKAQWPSMPAEHKEGNL